MNEIFNITINDNGSEETITLYNEPIGYDSVDFNLQQESGRYGRDVTFAGGEAELEFTPMAHPEIFDKLIEQYEKWGFEANVLLVISIGSYEYRGNLDFLTAEYNGYDSFKCMMIQETKATILKRRSDISVNLFGTEDLDENPSDAVNTERIFIPALRTGVRSVWTTDTEETYYAYHTEQVQLPRTIINNSRVISESGIKNTLINLEDSFSFNQNQPDAIKFPLLVEAQEDLYNVKVSVKTGGSYVNPLGFLESEGYTDAQIVVRYGNSFYDDPNAVTQVISTTGNVNQPTFLLGGSLSIPSILRGQKIWVWVQLYVFAGVSSFIYKDVEITIEAEASNLDIVTGGVKLYDAVKKVVKDAGNMETDFRLAQSGAYRNTYLFTGDMLRGIEEEFTLSFDDIIDFLPEANLDYEITNSGRLDISEFKYFYTEREIDVIEDVAFDTFKYTENEKFAINKFSFEFEKYQSQKEETENYTKNIVHGKGEYHINNKQVGESKEVKVKWVRDPFMLKDIIDKAFSESDSTATSEDNTVYAIDITDISEADYNIRKTAVLYHAIINENGVDLILRNDGSFNFELLGIQPNSNITIHNTPSGDATYVVLAVYPNYLELSGTVQITQSGEYFTDFTYSLKDNSGNAYVELKAKTRSGRTEGIVAPETFANYNFTVKHNIDNYWRNWLASCTKLNTTAKLVDYYNNDKYKEFTWTFNGYFYQELLTHDEGADINLSDIEPILSTKIVEIRLIMPFERYIRIVNLLRHNGGGELFVVDRMRYTRGFIRSFDTKGNPIYIYPQSMTARHKASGLKEVDVIGELKHIPNEINVTKVFFTYNVAWHQMTTLQYDVTGDNIVFKDMNNIKILKTYNYQNVKVSGVSYNNINDLVGALDNL